MINNRQNGRRRGRGSGAPRPNGSGNGQDRGNRIDNRARGNASQLHEKYKTLARDTQMQGDRVMTEYYLQFADHYFRVLSESRARFDEQRRPQGQDEFDDGDNDGQSASPDDRDDRDGFDEPRYEQQQRDYRPEPQQRDAQRQPQQQRDDRDARPPRDDREARPPREQREPRAEREQRPDRNYQDRPRRDANGSANGAVERGAEEPAPRIEIDRLPPALSIEPAMGASDDAAEAPRPRRGRRPRSETAPTPDAV